MKTTNKIISLLIILMLPCYLFGQTEQGVVRLGGNITFNHQIEESGDFGRENISHSNLMIQLEPGLFTGDQFLLGVDVGFFTEFYNGESIESDFQLGTQFSYYINSGSHQLYFPISINAGYIISKERFGDRKSIGIYYGASAGIEFIPNGNLGVRCSFGPRVRQYHYKNPSTKDITTNWDVQLGVAYYFKKQPEVE